MNKTLKIVLVAFALACIADSCDNEPISKTIPLEKVPSESLVVEKQDRFTVERYGQFKAGYGNAPREIVVIIDNQTHKQYLGVTDVGVYEMIIQDQVTK